MTFTRSPVTASTLYLAARASWSIYRVLRTIKALSNPDTTPPASDGPKLAVVVPLLDEAENVPALIEHWYLKLRAHPRLVLCICTTNREASGPGLGQRTWDALAQSAQFMALQDRGQAVAIHYPTANRTYGEQLRWALEQLSDHPPVDNLTHLYVANVDSRLSDQATNDLLRHVDAGAICAQQSALFFANLDRLPGPAAAEALFQSRWTLGHEYFRYLAGSGQISWLPDVVAKRWYQHAVGHGLLLSIDFLNEVGGLPTPRHGLEDAALGLTIRSRGYHITPMTTLECAEAPASVGELQRQRQTWVRGPACTPEYVPIRQHPALVAYGLYDAAKWTLGLPLAVALLARKRGPDRLAALAALAINLYGPALGTVYATQHLEIDQLCRPHPSRFTKALAWYPTAPVNYTIGGLCGVLALLRDLATGAEWTQHRTRHGSSDTNKTD